MSKRRDWDKIAEIIAKIKELGLKQKVIMSKFADRPVPCSGLRGTKRYSCAIP